MIRTLLIDDEAHCLARLKRLLETHCADTVRVEGTSGTLEEGLAAVQRLKPDVVFLDVQLGEDSGFELLRRASPVAFGVIFTTAYEKYAVEAFRCSALDYLLKPIDAEDLVGAVAKATRKSSTEALAGKIDTLFEYLKTIPGASKKIAIPTLEGLLFIDIADIIRCQSSLNYTILHLRSGRKLTVAKTLKEFDEQLSGYDFFRVHHSHLVNLKDILRYQKGKGGTLTMSDGSEIAVSTRKKEEFLKRLSRL